jgi:serpin B
MRGRPSTRALVSLLVVLAACGGGPLAAGDAEVARGTAPFQPSATASDITALVAADTAFSLDLIGRAWNGDNLIISPFSIATALGMLEAGARGETREQMAAVLHETLTDESLHDARGTLLAALASEPPSTDEEPPPFTLRAVNSLWAQRDYPIVEDYLEVLSGSYDAGVSLLDFMADPDAARVVINDAIAEQTEERITDLIPEGVITALTRLVLTNAVYFKANWLSEFSPDLTADGLFTTAGGSEVSVPMMHAASLIQYVDGNGYTAAWLPYVGDAAMMVILPDGDIEGLLATLTVDELAEARRSAGGFQVDLTMPRFEYRSQLGLSPVLQDLGMQAAFVPPPGDGTADLTGIVEARELYVQDVIHQGFVKVDEKGTEAAAATAIVVGATSMPEPASLVLDRPFLFLIQHQSSGEILFAGIVADPSA